MLQRLTIVALAATTVFSLEEYQFLASCDERAVPYKININGHGKPGESYFTRYTYLPSSLILIPSFTEISCAQPSCLGDEYKSHDKRGSHVRHNAFNVVSFPSPFYFFPLLLPLIEKFRPAMDTEMNNVLEKTNGLPASWKSLPREGRATS